MLVFGGNAIFFHAVCVCVADCTLRSNLIVRLAPGYNEAKALS
jgi:hypothetical protein